MWVVGVAHVPPPQLQPWGMTVGTKLLQLPARRLPTPKLVNGQFPVNVKGDQVPAHPCTRCMDMGGLAPRTSLPTAGLSQV